MKIDQKVLLPWASQTFLEGIGPTDNRMVDPLGYLPYHDTAGGSAGEARLVWDQEVGGSNPPTPTMLRPVNTLIEIPAPL